ncbi:hypothetical protein [Parasedimentitalea psychrophila]|uniref:Uncharacterized protein n=1 Tax=Parasedimentitalea psychrophila TaxID=2997337 RepID=A0A9Y2L1J5_9RHOB|nr:hypothetical protein [Parasedimentitalea psychrophila]WIY25857.1 hypothetical protein QPJ95_02680 [Parasedimentitalea psychrophila]
MSPLNAEQLAGQDNTTSPLRALLIRLCADVSGLQGERRDAAQGRANLMGSLLAEIDETILPRQLTLYFDQVVVARLRVSQRRLLSLELASDIGPADHAGLTSTVQVYAQQLHHLSARYQGTGFRITRQVCETGIETESCSASQLAESLASQQQDSRLERLLTMIGASADAWALQAETAGQNRSHGPAPLARQLMDLAATDRAAKQKNGHALRLPDKTPHYLLLSISSEIKLIVACDQTETLLIALPVQHLAAADAAWHMVFSAP